MQPNPHQQQPQQPTVGPLHSLPDPGPKLTCMRATQRTGQRESGPVLSLNPDPIAHLVGCSNEAPVIVDGQSDHVDQLGCPSFECKFLVL